MGNLIIREHRPRLFGLLRDEICCAQTTSRQRGEDCGWFRENELPPVRWLIGLLTGPLHAEFVQLALEIGPGCFEHAPMTPILDAVKLLQHVPQSQVKLFSLADSIRRFPRQSRLLSGYSGGCFVLLGFDRLAFPPPGHRDDYSFSAQQV